MNPLVRIGDGSTGATPALTHVRARSAGAEATPAFAAMTPTSDGSQTTLAQSRSGEEQRFRAVSARVAPSPTGPGECAQSGRGFAVESAAPAGEHLDRGRLLGG